MQGPDHLDHLTFKRIHTRLSSKTKSWEILERECRIGYVAWYASKSAYVFMPDAIRPYESNTLTSISTFLEDVMIEHTVGTPNSRDFVSSRKILRREYEKVVESS